MKYKSSAELLIMDKKKILSKIKLDWHRWPIYRESKIISIYECAIYVLLLIVGIIYYWCIQKVPFHDDGITVDLIKVARMHENHIPRLNIVYTIPNTFTLDGTGSVVISPKMKEDSCVYIFSPTHETNRLKQIKDSLLSIYGGDEYATQYFVRFEQQNSIFYQTLFYSTYEWEKNKDCFQRMYRNEKKYTGEWYVSDFGNGAPIASLRDVFKYGPLSRPSWLCLYDISQSYYNIKLNGNIDDTRLEIDFCGATDFSRMIPEPDTITMSSIIFTDSASISEIKRNGVRFHATFKELQGSQNTRNVLVSTILSALLAILITFLILGAYKSFIHLKYYQKGNHGESDLE